MPQPLFSIDVDTAPVFKALDGLPSQLHPLVLAACRTTAEAIVREARGRLQRQLSGASTGQTAAGIHAVPAYDGDGYVILADNDRMPNLPLWLEKGTKAGRRRNVARTDPRPFFYPSIEMEVSNHGRRIEDAMRDVAPVSGLGD